MSKVSIHCPAIEKGLTTDRLTWECTGGGFIHEFCTSDCSFLLVLFYYLSFTALVHLSLFVCSPLTMSCLKATVKFRAPVLFTHTSTSSCSGNLFREESDAPVISSVSLLLQNTPTLSTVSVYFGPTYSHYFRLVHQFVNTLNQYWPLWNIFCYLVSVPWRYIFRILKESSNHLLCATILMSSLGSTDAVWCLAAVSPHNYHKRALAMQVTLLFFRFISKHLFTSSCNLFQFL